MPTLQAAAKRCLRCATILRQNRSVCPSCGTEVGAQPAPARGPSAPAQAAPGRTSQPAAAVRPAAAQAPAQAPRKKVFCALCMKSLEPEQARAIVRDDPQVLEALGEALIQQHSGGNACEECLDTFRAKAQRQKAAAAGAPAPEDAPQPAAARPSPGAPPRQAAATGKAAVDPQQAVQAFETKPKPKLEPGPFYMWIFGGCVGGLIGNGIWLAIALPTGWTLAFIFLILQAAFVGAGVREGAKGFTGWLPGLLASVMALAFGLSTYYFLIKQEYTARFEQSEPVETLVIADIASDVDTEFEMDGTDTDVSIDLLENDIMRDDYTPAVWAEAEKRWNEMTEEDRAQKIAQYERDRDEAVTTVAGISLLLGIILSPTALLILGLTAATAYRNGAGALM
ncbi:MAG: hypothetical protein AMXMBFR7_10140 [Planctomycetota bacterium]